MPMSSFRPQSKTHGNFHESVSQNRVPGHLGKWDLETRLTTGLAGWARLPGRTEFKIQFFHPHLHASFSSSVKQEDTSTAWKDTGDRGNWCLMYSGAFFLLQP